MKPLTFLAVFFLAVSAARSQTASDTVTNPYGGTMYATVSVSEVNSGTYWTYNVTMSGQSVPVAGHGSGGNGSLVTATYVNAGYTYSHTDVHGVADSTGTSTQNFTWTGSWHTDNINQRIATFTFKVRNSYGSSSFTDGPLKTITVGANQPQTCTITNASAPAVSGQTITGTASGAQGGNPYNISVVSGPASAAINSSTGAYTVTATGAGTISYKVWISGGNGYDRSNDATGGGTVANSKKVKVTLPANNGNYPIQYTLWQNGVSIGSYTQTPGNGAYILTIDVGADGGAVTVTSKVIGLFIDPNGNYISDPSKESSTGIIDTVTPTADPNASAVDLTPPPANTAKDPSTPATKSDTVWSQDAQNKTDPTAQTDLLTNATYREGVDKIKSVLEAAKNSSDTGLSSDSSTLDTSSLPESVPNVTVDKVNTLLGKLPEAPTLVPPSSGVSSITLTFPLITAIGLTHDYTFTWDYSGWVSVMSWLRLFVLGCLSIGFYLAINKQLRNSVAD